MVRRLLEVNKLVLTPKGEAYSEPQMDRKGRIMMEEMDGTENVWKFQHQIERKDTPVYVDKRIGDIITFALDKVDEKASGEEIRKRFSLSCKIEAAMQNGGTLAVESKDMKLIEATLENIKHPLFNFRIQEALDLAEIVPEV